MIFVTKRDGSKEEFNPRKIESAILKAFDACGIDPSKKDKKLINVF